jgi:AcrR family transcriptional regulator
LIYLFNIDRLENMLKTIKNNANVANSKPSKNGYHHGDLRSSLLSAAGEMIAEDGIDELSLRKLASRVGVSRTAPYHHFEDKNELLCAIAEHGFRQRHRLARQSFDDQTLSMHDKFKAYIYDYVKFAGDNPELYELMFGRTIWKQQKSTKELRATAYPCFQHQVEMTGEWQKTGLLNQDENTLRLSQVIWGTIHGIAKLYIDGIYTHTSQVEEICESAVNMFIGQSS